MEIVVKNLMKEFKNIIILNDVNLKFLDGNIYGLHGRNGSGKSVFLKLLCGLYLPTSGTILYDNKIYNFKNDFPPFVGALIERPSFFADMSGYDNLKLLASIKKVADDNQILEAMKVVNLLDQKDKIFNKYSLGMKQKLGIAQAIMENQKVIILDEPFNGIEDISVKKIKKYLLKLKEQGKIVILSSHIIDDLNEICDKIYYFDNGYVVEK